MSSAQKSIRLKQDDHVVVFFGTARCWPQLPASLDQLLIRRQCSTLTKNSKHLKSAREGIIITLTETLEDTLYIFVILSNWRRVAEKWRRSEGEGEVAERRAFDYNLTELRRSDGGWSAAVADPCQLGDSRSAAAAAVAWRGQQPLRRGATTSRRRSANPSNGTQQ